MLSLVCPVYNERDNINRQLDELIEKISVPFELIVVYDFDEDNTLPIIRERIAQLPFTVRLVRNAFGRGALNAVKTGLAASRSSVASCVIMADLSDDIIVINSMFHLMQAERLDVVNGSRYMSGGKQIGGPRLKSLLSRLAGLSLHYVGGLPTHDATNNFKMYRSSFLAAVPIESTAGFEVGLELVAKAYVKGFRIGEAPSTWKDRVAGDSRFDMKKWLPQYLKWYFYGFWGRFSHQAATRVRRSQP